MKIDKWEYKKFDWQQSPNVGILNKLGAEGWELVDAVHPGHPWSSVYTFKRRVSDQPAEVAAA